MQEGFIRICVCIFMVFTSVGCSNNPIFDVVPQIEFVSISPATVKKDSIDAMQLTLHFQDGDGDLGNINQGDTLSAVYLQDVRPEVRDSAWSVFSYNLPNLTPENASRPSIQGNITITFDSPRLTKDAVVPYTGPNQEEVIYEVYLTDRTGNKSNVILTPPIVITQ